MEAVIQQLIENAVQQALAPLHHELNAIQEQQTAMQEQLSAITAQMQQREEALPQVQQQQQEQQNALEQKIELLLSRTSMDLRLALHHNSLCHGNDQLHPVPHQDSGLLPKAFPATLSDLGTLPVPQLLKLLQFYGAPTDGDRFELTYRLRRYIGA
ncbi:hypothetical protein N2152v2_010867 [Parachlorella kessleri]